MGKYSLAPQRGFFPQPSYLIGTYKDNGVPNFALITWVTFCSANPPMFMFASAGKKITRELVEKNKMFSANLVTTEMMFLADYFGMNSGYSSNKVSDIGVECSIGEILPVPILNPSPWVYECQLIDIVPQGNGAIYIGEVKNIQVDEKIKDTAYGKINMSDIDPLIYAPGNYYKVSENIGQVGFSKQK
ncbi:flavin reductase family protein [Clostridium sp. YIM B02515]|uniref:Flavin reductase family protein n=1 Tax=Clostridium rhizosphaerae TaxID=2803861 RepID=A0ABS1TEP7_9CLOT|nr:flavin reductase family protein [Clostridium rhizosphaerae]MBL4937858.1 flavin reductase family protein [Clostridium rhizosphaerae]